MQQLEYQRFFIPLPNAIDDHQTANANYLVNAGAGILLAQSELNEKTLIEAIESIKKTIGRNEHCSKK